MREHELLYFIDALTCGVHQQPGRRNDAPTREELATNYFKFHKSFGTKSAGLSVVLHRLAAKGAVRLAPCSAHCHARHVWMTAKGRALLEHWNEVGCDTENREGEQRCVKINEGFTAADYAA